MRIELDRFSAIRMLEFNWMSKLTCSGVKIRTDDERAGYAIDPHKDRYHTHESPVQSDGRDTPDQDSKKEEKAEFDSKDGSPSHDVICITEFQVSDKRLFQLCF